MLLNVLLRLTGSLQAPGGAAFPGLLSFPPGMPSFSTTASPVALSGLHNSVMQSALLQVSIYSSEATALCLIIKGPLDVVIIMPAIMITTKIF